MRPRVSRPAAPASLRKHGVCAAYCSGSVPGARPQRDSSGAEAAIIGVGALFAFLWKLVIFVLVVGAIAGFIWGGSNDAHLRCLDHRLGAPGLIDSLACVFEH